MSINCLFTFLVTLPDSEMYNHFQFTTKKLHTLHFNIQCIILWFQGHRDDVSESGYSGDSYSSGRYDRYGGRDNKAADKWTADPPTNTIILKGISSSIDEKDVREKHCFESLLLQVNLPIKCPL